MTVSQESELLPLVAEIVSAFVFNNALSSADLPEMIRSTYTALARIHGAPAEVTPQKPQPAVPVTKSVLPEYIICLEDGKKLKMLKRHLSTAYGLTPELYRERWGLPATYPMVAPNYAKRRSNLAKGSGLGRSTVESPAPSEAEIKIVPEGVSGLKRAYKRAA
jgi:predicted transcriptional regulator